MKTIMDVEVGSQEDKDAVELVAQTWTENKELYEKAKKLVDQLGLGGFWAGYYAAMAAVIMALNNEKGV